MSRRTLVSYAVAGVLVLAAIAVSASDVKADGGDENCLKCYPGEPCASTLGNGVRFCSQCPTETCSIT
jgi:hypothetical protein